MTGRIVLTGGAGFVGSHVADHLLASDPDVRITILDKITYAADFRNVAGALTRPHTRLVVGDICDLDTCLEITRDVDLVIHLAAESHVDNSFGNSLHFTRVNVLGTHTLAEACRINRVPRLLHVSCYDEETRALTTDGLRRFDELSEGQTVFGVDDDGRLMPQTIRKVIVQDYDGEMVRIKKHRIDFVVTPNHRMYGMEDGRIVVEEASETELRTRPLEMIRPRRWAGVNPATIAVDGVGELPAPDLLYICGLFIGDGFVSDQVKVIPNRSGLSFKEMMIQCRDPVTGRLVSRPGMGDRATTEMNSYRVFFDIPTSDPARARLCAALTQLGIKFSCHAGKSGEHVYVGDKRWSDFFRQFGKGAKNKRIPRWILELDRPLLARLFVGLIDSDGHDRSTPAYTTTSEGLVGDLFELGLKLGLLPRVANEHSDSVIVDEYSPLGRRVVGDAFYVHFSQVKNPIVTGSDTSRIPYRGKVWCVTVATKNLFVERHGRVALCGNTDEVYGDILEGAFTEDSPLAPTNPYSASKAGAEMVLRGYVSSFGLPVIMCRGNNIFGTRQYPEKIIPKFCLLLGRDQPLTVHGDGTNVRTYLAVQDFAEAIRRLVLLGRVGEVYNVGTTEEYTNLAVAKMLSERFGKPSADISFVTDRPFNDRRYSVDCQKIAGLGWSPQRTLAGELDKIVTWYKSNAGRYDRVVT